MIELYKVGGCVRDEIMGLKPHDIDYVAVGADSFEDLEIWLKDHGAMIWLSKPEFLTVRAKLGGIDADFVLSRKDGAYTDGRHPDEVVIGSLMDDLSRRDFTMNALAKGWGGTIIDPFKGREDIEAKIIRAVGDPVDRINEDALRALRAIRFSVTKGFRIEPDLEWTIRTQRTSNLIETTVSVERVREELDKMFRFDQRASFDAMNKFPSIFHTAMDMGVWFKPTTGGR